MSHDAPLTLARGEEKALPHTLSSTRHLTLILVGVDKAAGTAVVELRNPEAEPDAMVAGLVEDNAHDVERSNRHRDLVGLPEKAVPVDTSTETDQQISCRLHEKLQIGDRVWKVTGIDEDTVTLTPGFDHEDRTWLDELEELPYTPTAIRVEEDLGTVEKSL